MTRERAIEMLKYNSNVIHKTVNGETDPNEVKALDMAIKALEQPESYWIPVSKRLPEKPNMYMVTDSNGDVVRFVYTGTDSSRKYWLRCAKAWMPLPEPYKEVTE